MGRTACYFVFLIVFLLPLGHVDMAESPFWYCGISNYTANSTYGHNLRRALASLAANISLSSFYNATQGRKPDQVTAAVQCRGDLVGETCQACVSESTTQVIQRCPNSRAAGFALRACILHYRDASVPLPGFFMYMSFPGPGAIPDPQRFRPMLISFFNNLIVSAITSPEHLFWSDKFEYTNNVTVYGTAQCIAILAPQDCKACLDIAFTRMLKYTADRHGGTIFYRMTCSVRYETYPFFTPSSHQIALNRLNFVASNCSPPASSGMAATPFHRNLKILLPLLTEEAPISGFYDDAMGLGSNQVHGQVLCRGDVSVNVCWNCTAQASAKIQELCPSSRRATIWLDRCQLRYSDVKFAGTVDVYDRACVPAPEDASSPASFNQNLRMLISNLTLLVAQSFPISLFATGTCVVSDSQRIYALVQCVRDIPVDQCKWCLQNASADIEGCCNGKQGGRVLRGSCNLRFGVEPFFLGDPTFVSLPQPGHRHKRWWIFAIIGIIGGVVLAGVLWALCLAPRRRPLLKIVKYKEASSLDVGSIEEDKVDYDLPQISLKAIQSATDNFSEENKLGEGGYGPVYKGKLPNGQEVAVKRPSGNSGQGLKEFRNEIKLIAKLQHINLVRLIGCCLEKGEKLLIYEYMPNKSLDAVLKDPGGHMSLDWGKRSNIIMGIARGLLYLHQDSRLNIIHRDLKAGNVLLDEQLNPKISDFGMARIFSGVHGQATTSVVVGTYGYMAPEYVMEGVFSTKSDVYSFGILLLEIISGQLNASFVATHQTHTLVEHAWRSWCEHKGTDFVDAVMKDTCSTIEMLRCLQIGLLCIQEDAASRPSMSTVVLMLGNPSLDLPLPTQPSFIRENVAESCQLISSERESASHF